MGNKKIKRIACDFFYWWWNQPGNNTEQGFDDWWKENRTKYVGIRRFFKKRKA